jgi:hypothetical protein
MFFVLACSQEKSEKEMVDVTSENGLRVWLQTDTLYSTVKWTSDSLRQIKLDLDYINDIQLEVNSDGPVYLFQKNSLLAKSSDGILKYSFNSETNKEEIYLTLDRNLRKLSYGLYFIEDKDENKAYLALKNEGRESKWISDNILIFLLIGGAIFLAIIKINYEKRSGDILSVNKIFTTRLNEGEQSRVRIMDQDNLVFAGFYSFLTAGLIYFLSSGSNVGFLGIEAQGITEYLKFLAIVAIALVSKVILIAIVSNLFGNSKIPAFYVKEMLNINLFFLIILFFSSILIFLFTGGIPAFWLTIAIYGVLFFYVIRLLLLYFKILKLSSFSNLYLFSYFCTTEIFPFLIGLKYFMR